MIEHASIPVKDVAKAKAFYAAALAPLGYKLNMEFEDAAGFMESGHTSFWIGAAKKPQPTHIAFRAPGKEAVDEFHKAALAAGAEDNGAPGYRDYSPGYYAAFVHDADGNNIEAVWFDPEKE
jgi:predicted lactoylglutathione lyase